jgi:hypothetical protein
VPGTDYTASTKTSIVLTQAASLNDTLEVVAYDIASMSDMSASNGGTFQADVTFADGADIITASAGTDNVRLGEDAGASIASGGNQNVVIGKDAGTALTTGDSNTFIGANVGDAITTSSGNVAIGGDATYAALGSDTQGKFTTAIGVGALRAQNFTSDTQTNNTAIGYFAGGVMTTGTANTFVGSLAGDDCIDGIQNVAVGYAALSADAGNNNTAVGESALTSTTGANNTAIGNGAGNAITTGEKNSILGVYNGNQGGLDIRTTSNNIVLSDGDGNVRGYITSDGFFKAVAGATAYLSQTNHSFASTETEGNVLCNFLTSAHSGQNSVLIYTTSTEFGINTSGTVIRVAKNGSTSRSINASGTINASGADYAEYMVKSGDFTLAKGDIAGINSEGKLTNVFADAISFIVKSTNPSYVGGDTWGTDEVLGEEPSDEAPQEEKDTYNAALEAARATVDRMAFSGQVPVNVTGASVGDFIIPVQDGTGITGQAVSSPTLEQYMSAVGKVIAIEDDGRAKIIVKVA